MTKSVTLGRSGKPLAIQASPTTVSTNGGGTTISKTQGPLGTPSYNWVRTSGSTNITISNSSSATPTFNSATTGSFSAVFTVTATLAGQQATAIVTVTITISAFTASVSGGPASGSSNGHSATNTASNSVSAIGSGGVAPVASYSWVCTGGITVNSPNTQTTNFSANVGTRTTLNGTATCTLVDHVGNVTTCSTSVSLTNTGYPTLSASNGGSVSGTSTSSSTVNVTSGGAQAFGSGGDGSYGYSWAPPAGMTGDNLGGQTCAFTKALGPGGTASGNAVCTVTSGDGQSTTTTVAVSLQNNGSAYTPVSATIDNPSISATGSNSSGASAGPTTATGHNGTGSYTYTWSRVDGDFRIGAVSPSNNLTFFQAPSQPSDSEISGDWKCTVSDGTTSDVVFVSIVLTKGTPP